MKNINGYEIHKNGYLQCKCGNVDSFRIWQYTKEVQEYVTDMGILIFKKEWYLKDVDADIVRTDIECRNCQAVESIDGAELDIKDINLQKWEVE